MHRENMYDANFQKSSTDTQRFSYNNEQFPENYNYNSYVAPLPSSSQSTSATIAPLANNNQATRSFNNSFTDLENDDDNDDDDDTDDSLCDTTDDEERVEERAKSKRAGKPKKPAGKPSKKLCKMFSSQFSSSENPMNSSDNSNSVESFLQQHASSSQYLSQIANISCKRKRKRILNRLQRAEATMREKRRMLKLNKAFEELRKVLPVSEFAKNKLSRAETLKSAIEYIENMSELLSI